MAMGVIRHYNGESLMRIYFECTTESHEFGHIEPPFSGLDFSNPRMRYAQHYCNLAHIKTLIFSDLAQPNQQRAIRGRMYAFHGGQRMPSKLMYPKKVLIAFL